MFELTFHIIFSRFKGLNHRHFITKLYAFSEMHVCYLVLRAYFLVNGQIDEILRLNILVGFGELTPMHHGAFKTYLILDPLDRTYTN